MAYRMGNLTLPELEEILRKKRANLLIDPLTAVGPDMTGVPTAPAPATLPAVPVSPRAASQMTPEEVQAIRSVSSKEKIGNVLEILGMLATLVNPLAGPMAAGYGRRMKREGRGRRAARVALAEREEALGVERGFKEREMGVREREVGAREREAGAAERRAMTGERELEATKAYRKRMLDIEAERNLIELLKIEATKGGKLGKEDRDQLKFLNDLVKDRVDLKARTAVESYPLLGKMGKIPTLLTDSWWAEEAAEVARGYNEPRVVPESKVRARRLKEIVDISKAGGAPYEAAKELIAKKLAAKVITSTEANAMIEYLDFLMKAPAERAYESFGKKK